MQNYIKIIRDSLDNLGENSDNSTIKWMFTRHPVHITSDWDEFISGFPIVKENAKQLYDNVKQNVKQSLKDRLNDNKKATAALDKMASGSDFNTNGNHHMAVILESTRPALSGHSNYQF